MTGNISMSFWQMVKDAESFGEESELEVLTRKPIVAEPEELFINPRARSAKLRAAKKVI